MCRMPSFQIKTHFIHFNYALNVREKIKCGIKAQKISNRIQESVSERSISKFYDTKK